MEGSADTPGSVTPKCVTAIYLGQQLLTGSSDLPEDSSEQLSGVFCMVLLPVRFT